jgi:pyruvate dehydrogenase E2 component (dihydrolipoamide acetyltransferase)
VTHKIIMPDLGQTAAEAKILRWLRKCGEHISKGDALLTVETDKVTMDVEAYRTGYLREILVGEGEMASAMSTVAILTDHPDERPGDSPELLPAHTPENGTLQVAFSGVSVKGPGTNRNLTEGGPRRPLATPAARRRARDLGLDLSQLVASRADGLVTCRDVDQAQPESSAKPVHLMAAITVKSLQTIPHFCAVVEADVSDTLEWRRQWNLNHPQSRLSLNDVFVRVAALALRDIPEINVRFSCGMIEQRKSADVLLVVATGRGLWWVPLQDPACSGWEAHAAMMRQALKRVEEGTPAVALPEAVPALAMSNLGMFGVTQFTAIVPPDSAAILAVGAARQEPIVRNGRIEIGDRCTLTLSADHRVVDGVTAARFLQRVQFHLKSL